MCTRTAKRLTRRCLRFDNRANRALLYPCFTLVLFSSTFHLLLFHLLLYEAALEAPSTLNRIAPIRCQWLPIPIIKIYVSQIITTN